VVFYFTFIYLFFQAASAATVAFGGGCAEKPEQSDGCQHKGCGYD
jgi:hypothetical protein